MLSHAKGLQLAKAAMGVRLSAGGTTPSIDEIAAAADRQQPQLLEGAEVMNRLFPDRSRHAIIVQLGPHEG
ncbi:hypothetical protein [Streptosporangium sp. LJ11]|uniref:hypothetical protein n=1 Tax=Streptosporangium sp. LJ11 TaxID=3436927 RepID=UPI003F7A3761